MRKLLPLAILLALASGCKKAAVQVAAPNQQQQPPPQAPNQPNQPNVHAPTGVVTNPNLGGGGGGAGMAVKKAAKRAANQNDLNTLRTLMAAYETENNRMPTRDEMATLLKKDAPNVYKLWEEQVIEITGTQSRAGVWAYTVEDQSSAGYHLAIVNGGIERLTPAELERRKKG